MFRLGLAPQCLRSAARTVGSEQKGALVSGVRTLLPRAIAGLAALAVVSTTPAVGDVMQRCFGSDPTGRIDACTALLDEPLTRMERSLAYAMRALAYSVRGEYATALPDYDRAIELRPDFAVALNNRAWALVSGPIS